jgi:hypothetical protein
VPHHALLKVASSDIPPLLYKLGLAGELTKQGNKKKLM